MENKKETVEISGRKTLSIVGFLVSIILLMLAIFLSVSQDSVEKLATIETTTEEQNLVEIVSSDLSKNINEVIEENTISTATNAIEENTAVVSEKKVYTNAPTETERELFSEDIVQTTATEPIEIEEPKEQEEVQIKEQFIKPVDGEITRGYSMDSLVYSETLQEWVTHRGIDIKADKLTEVKASCDGKVKSIKTDPRFGLSVTIEHSDGFETVYSCLVSCDQVQEGQEVKQGDVIGNVGNSGVFEVADGTHLHFEILKDGNYVNPEIYIK